MLYGEHSMPFTARNARQCIEAQKNGERLPTRPCHTTRHAGPHRAVQRVTQGHRTAEEDQESRSRRAEARWTRPGCSPHARDRAGYPLFVQRVPFQPRVDVASHIAAASRVSIASRSWTADDGVSIDPVAVAVRVSDRSRSSPSSPLSRPSVLSAFVPD
jgi:hypothetical protein